MNNTTKPGRILAMKHQDIKKIVNKPMRERLAHLVVYRSNNVSSSICYIGGPVVAATSLGLDRYILGEKKSDIVKPEQALRIAHYIKDTLNERKIDYVVVDCGYSIGVGRAIALASNISLGFLPKDYITNEKIDAIVYNAMMDAYKTLKSNKKANDY